MSAMEVEPEPPTPLKTRVSGRTAGQEIAAEKATELDESPMTDDRVTPEERRETFDDLNFSRMRTDWSGDDAHLLHRVEAFVDEQIAELFGDAHAAVFEMWDTVRTQAVDQDSGELRFHEDGSPVYVMLEGGGYQEDWTRLGYEQRQNLLFTIVTNLFRWEQIASQLWFEAMYAKFRWTVADARAYDEAKGTIEARTARANLLSDDERMFALLRTYISRRADAVVRSLQRIEQRLKDVITA